MLEHISGLMVGDAANCQRLKDWLLAPIGAYKQFVEELIPAVHHQAVFFNTAVHVFPMIAPLVK